MQKASQILFATTEYNLEKERKKWRKGEREKYRNRERKQASKTERENGFEYLEHNFPENSLHTFNQ